MEKKYTSLRAEKAEYERRIERINQILTHMDEINNQRLSEEERAEHQKEAWQLMKEIEVLDVNDIHQYKKGLRLIMIGKKLNHSEYREIGRNFYESHCRQVSHKYFDAMSNQ